MSRILVPPLATAWIVLSALLAFLGSGQHLHRAGLGLAVPAIIIAAGWVLGWLRSEAWQVAGDRRDYWLLWGLGLAPVLGLSAFPLLRAGSDGVLIATLKALLFVMPCIGLAWGAKAWMARANVRPQASPASEIPPQFVEKRSISPGRLAVAIGDARRILDADQILWLEVDDNYVRIHTADAEYDVRQSLRDVLTQLGAGRFARIHKSHAVNLAEIALICPTAKGDAEVHLRNGRRLRMSRRYRQELRPL